jgi:hypothetical protein
MSPTVPPISTITRGFLRARGGDGADGALISSVMCGSLSTVRPEVGAAALLRSLEP